MGNERGRKVDERQIVTALDFPADQERTKAIVPAVRALNHPPPRFPVRPPHERRLAFLSNVRDDPTVADGAVAVAKRIAFVEAAVLWASHPAASLQDDGVEGPGQRPFVVEIRAA